MHPDTPIATQDIRADAPAGHDIRSAARWDLARHDYLAGDSGRQVCDRYGLSLSTFNQRARRDGWRKCDQPDPDPVPDDDPEADQPVDCAALAEEALVHVRGALRRGRAGEASSWMRLHEKLLARLEAEAARERRREQVARRQGSNGAEEALANALRPLRERMAFINTLGSAQIRVGRAWSQAISPPTSITASTNCTAARSGCWTGVLPLSTPRRSLRRPMRTVHTRIFPRRPIPDPERARPSANPSADLLRD